MLDELNDVFQLLKTHWKELLYPGAWGKEVVREGRLYCSNCGADRRMAVTTILLSHGCYGGSKPDTVNQSFPIPCSQAPDHVFPQLKHGLLRFQCVECHKDSSALIYRGPQGLSLAVFPSCYGGLATPHTPDGVQFYLDQAHRAQSVDAKSAAVAMYRAALEHLLFEQGYTQGTCGKKLQQLEAAVEKKQAPKWALDINPQFLQALKKLGDGAIHPNDGDVTKQAALDKEALAAIQATFAMLLDVVYERPHEEQERLRVLQQAQSELDASEGND